MLSLATVPSSSVIMANLGEYSAPLFTDLLPFAYLIGGLLIGAGLIVLVISGIAYAVSHLFHRK